MSCFCSDPDIYSFFPLASKLHTGTRHSERNESAPLHAESSGARRAHHSTHHTAQVGEPCTAHFANSRTRVVQASHIKQRSRRCPCLCLLYFAGECTSLCGMSLILCFKWTGRRNNSVPLFWSVILLCGCARACCVLCAVCCVLCAVLCAAAFLQHMYPCYTAYNTTTTTTAAAATTTVNFFVSTITAGAAVFVQCPAKHAHTRSSAC